MDDADDLGDAVAGFRRAELALAAIVADADRLVDARSEVEQARDELKVVAGALVGLATAHRDLLGQLGEAAAALRPTERAEEIRLLVALQDAEDARARQVAEVADAVESLAHRLDRALAERIGGVVAELASTLPTAAQLSGLADRLDGPATADRLAALAERLDTLPDAGRLAALADRLDGLPTSAQLDGLATSAQLEKVADAVSGLASSDEVAAVAQRLDFDWLVERLDAVDRLPSAEQLAAVHDLFTALATMADLGRLDELATTSDLEAMELRLCGGLPAGSAPEPAVEEVAERAAARAAQAVEDQVAQLVEQVQGGQRRVHQLVLAVGVSFLLFAALLSVLALR